MRVGCIGLGSTGSGMASSLLKAGFEVMVWNRYPEPVAALREQGAVVADTAADIVRCGVVHSMLADDAVPDWAAPARMAAARAHPGQRA